MYLKGALGASAQSTLEIHNIIVGEAMLGTEPSFVTVDGRKLAYSEVSPPNPKGTILLLTGLAAKRYGWYKQFEVFGRSYRTVALDHRDISDSDEVTSAYTAADMADDAAAALKALGVERAH